MPKTLTIAINGCSHGEFHNIFQTIQHIKETHNISTDLLLCCGDFEAIRPEPFPDLRSMACPEKYLQYGDFKDFYLASDDGPTTGQQHGVSTQDNKEMTVDEMEDGLKMANSSHGDNDTMPLTDSLKETDPKEDSAKADIIKDCPTTLFIGGNHESSHYLAELPYGGWVSENIFYLGRCGTIRFGYSEHNSVLIGGVSGIFKQYNFEKGFFEKYPLAENEKRSVYHIRHWDQWRMEQLHDLPDVLGKTKGDVPTSLPDNMEDVIEHVDSLPSDEQQHTPHGRPSSQWTIGMSHEWPRNITEFADPKYLEKEIFGRQKKNHFRQQIQEGDLGCPVTRRLFDTFQPDYWFSGHMHCDIAVKCKHPSGGQTNFLGLDKVRPRRKFLQILQIELPDEPEEGQKLDFFYDRNWLSVIKATHDLTPTTQARVHLPKSFAEPLREACEFVEDNIRTNGEDMLRVSRDFRKHEYRADDPLFNPHTTRFFRELDLNPEVLNNQVRRALPPQYQDFTSSYHQMNEPPRHRRHQQDSHGWRHQRAPHSRTTRPPHQHNRNFDPTGKNHHRPRGRGGRGRGRNNRPSPQFDSDVSPDGGRGRGRGGGGGQGHSHTARGRRSPGVGSSRSSTRGATPKRSVNPEEIEL
eukprot:CAMPEP_0117441918 /NCGR_PEP_ID=MMETSP0759-20121206/3881_1 /TAXON_ID=63605 /ORGANISM="Percolomonas cosmopolitus, Strain WS" /LENGTH=634 /DNA_ID=CAMNT_0005233785 /DNA_START=19 /DNA_END=1923 /DNA_ORIENTATION=+